jgi:hypothetical protein
MIFRLDQFGMNRLHQPQTDPNQFHGCEAPIRNNILANLQKKEAALLGPPQMILQGEFSIDDWTALY